MTEFFNVLAPVDAFEVLRKHLRPLDAEAVDTTVALGRVTAEEVRSPEPLPAFPRSTMDGYSVRAQDTFGASEAMPAYLEVVGEVPMGKAAEVNLATGQAAVAYTGGMLAGSADAVVMVERTQKVDERNIEVLRPVAPGENVVQSGEDVRRGDPVLPKGRVGIFLPPTQLATMPGTPMEPAAAAEPPAAREPAPGALFPPRPAGPREERVRMTRLRRRVAERLKEAQNTAAMLTTFNEADMTAVMEMRARYRDAFEKKHGVRVGFMSFFVKACVVALREFPAVNGEIDGDDIVYKNHYDIGVAVGSPQGLVVPVVRDADALSFADIEKSIADFGRRARDGKLALDDLQGGTFTITNGGVFGSLLSTPILNPPQSGILGMHKIQKRPMVTADDSIAARPMMYLALGYDHRIVDGREAVSFLVRVKDCIEDPQRIMLDA